jgi:amino acid permease
LVGNSFFPGPVPQHCSRKNKASRNEFGFSITGRFTGFVLSSHSVPVRLAVVLILPLCFTKKIDFLKYAAAMGVFVILYVVGLIIYEYFR